MASTRIGKKFADRLTGNLSAGIEDAADDGGIERWHIVEEIGAVGHRQARDRDRVFDGDTLSGQLAGNAAFDGRLDQPRAKAILARLRTREGALSGVGLGQKLLEIVDARVGKCDFGSIASKHRRGFWGNRQTEAQRRSNHIIGRRRPVTLHFD